MTLLSYNIKIRILTNNFYFCSNSLFLMELSLNKDFHSHYVLRNALLKSYLRSRQEEEFVELTD